MEILMNTNTITEQLKQVSWTGRYAYALMCGEKYLTSKYPHKEWGTLFSLLWEATSLETLDEWSEKVIDILPECFFEFDCFEKSDFNHLTKADYEKFHVLYQGLGSDFTQLIEYIYKIFEDCAYASIEGTGQKSLSTIACILKMLEDESIPAPDPQSVAFSKFSEKNGWGEPFNGTKLSMVLKG